MLALGSTKFAVRENACEYLVQLGSPIVPVLRKAYENASDPEIRLRTKVLIQHLNFGDEESRIESFLAGEDVDFEGWRELSFHFGDNPKSRELFIQVFRSYPDTLSALTGTSRDRALAMMKVAARTQEDRTRLGWQPKLADAIAMLLPAVDRSIPITASYEDTMMFIINLNPVNKVAKDPFLSEPFRDLLSGWIRRSTIENREEVLNFGLNWELPIVYPLAIQTLDQTTDVHTVAVAMTALARYGNAIDARNLVGMLRDERVVSDKHFVAGRSVVTKVCDVALAAIVIMRRENLKDYGFSERAKHEKFGLIYDDVGFEPNQNGEDARKAAIKKIEAVVAKAQEFSIPQLK